MIPIHLSIDFFPFYHLESFIRAFVVQKLPGIPADALLISLLRLCAGLRDFCGFDKVSRRFPAYPHRGADPDVRQQYFNGHFCYAVKGGIVTNGPGICRHIVFFDDDFRKRHPEVSSPRSDCPDKDKEIGDSVTSSPSSPISRLLTKTMHYKTFLCNPSVTIQPR